MSEVRPYRRVLLTGLCIQVLAVLIGFGFLYTCRSGGVPWHDVSETLYWGTLGVLGFMFLGMASPGTYVLIIVMSLLIVAGLRRKRLWFLWLLALMLWGLWWVALTSEICSSSD
ncbi:MAG TPA: hypothetical protein VHS05_12675 [Pyrinomonadaceae bacterium]|jgi:hypothetical protein|nr:hypothetical protein [Pyrinomonadaceae bacterium]